MDSLFSFLIILYFFFVMLVSWTQKLVTDLFGGGQYSEKYYNFDLGEVDGAEMDSRPLKICNLFSEKSADGKQLPIQDYLTQFFYIWFLPIKFEQN